MADQNFRIKIELADSAAQKALADFVKQTGTADKALGGLNKSIGGLDKAANTTKGSLNGVVQIISGELGDKGASSVGRLASVFNGPLLAALGSVAVVGFALSKALDLTLTAERNTQVINSFNNLAESAGLAGDALKAALLASTQGLADDGQTLEAANRSILELGSNAGRIPEIMEIARKSTALFGGELLQNFENLSTALASGNVRALRNIGLVIDAQEAQEKYAASLGVTANQLTEAGRRQAIQNAALEQAQEKFKDIDESSNQATQSLQRFKVATGQLAGTVADTVQNSSLFSSTFDFLAKSVDGLGSLLKGKFGSELDQTDFKLKEASTAAFNFGKTLEVLEAKLANTTNPSAGLLEAVELTRQRAANANAEVQRLRQSIDQLSGADAPTVPKPPPQQEAQVDQGVILKERIDNETALANAALEVQRATAQLEVEINRDKFAQFQITADEFALKTFENEVAAIDAKRALEEQQFLESNQALEASLNQKVITETAFKAKRDALADQYTAKVLSNDAAQLRSATKLREQEDRLQQQKVRAVADTFGNLASLTQSSNKELFAIGKAASIASASINTYEAITRTMASVPYPFNIPLAIAQGVAGFVQVANIAQTNPSFEQGGIVGGNSFTGDRIQANVNSREMILNQGQQAQLFKMANGVGGGADMETTNRLLSMIASSLQENQTIQIDGREIIQVLRNQTASGRRFDS